MKKTKKKQPKNSQPKPKLSFWPETGVMQIAHRGGDGAGNSKRNTLEAFQAASDLGYSYAETDIILAASGELVTIHGSYNWMQASVQRDISRPVLQKMTLDQIRHTFKPGGVQIPTLEEVLTSFPAMKFFIDLKTDEAVEPLAKLLKRLKSFDRICIVGRGYQRNRWFADISKPAKPMIGLTVGRGVRFQNINMVLLKSGRLEGVAAILLHHSLVSSPMISLIHRRGFKAVVWTANSKLAINHAVRSGADGVISDKIRLLKEVISSN
jgi:glycerophosphoryl diester phosphodiesterase